jgi:hypothetical protein
VGPFLWLETLNQAWMQRESEDGVNQNIKLISWYRLLISCVEGIHKGSNKMIKYCDKVFYHVK